MDEVINLRARLKTPFVWNGFSDMLKDILNEAKENNDILDISTCRFGPDCAYQIDDMNNSGAVRIINSTEPVLNEILQHNKRAEAIRVGTIPNNVEKRRIWLDFEETGDKSVKSLLAEIKSSDQSVIWYATSDQRGYTENYDIIMSILNMQFYKRMFDISCSQKLTRIFLTYRSVMDVNDLVDENVFWYIIGNEYAIRAEVNGRGEVSIPAIGTFAKEEFITKDGVIPYWIGTESIANNERRLELRNRLIKQIKTVDMMSRGAKSKSILGLIKQYGDN